ncbi:MAG: hypothetical protein QM784_23835 [Polyangiaceae bacterium]
MSQFDAKREIPVDSESDLSRLQAKYRKLQRAIEVGDLSHARFLFQTIEALQSRVPPLSEVAQEAFDALGVIIATESELEVKAAFDSFKIALEQQVDREEAYTEHTAPTWRPPPRESDIPRGSEVPTPSGIAPRYSEEFSVEAVDQELPESATLFSIELSA